MDTNSKANKRGKTENPSIRKERISCYGIYVCFKTAVPLLIQSKEADTVWTLLSGFDFISPVSQIDFNHSAVSK